MKGKKMQNKLIEMDWPELQKRIFLALASCFPLLPRSSASFGFLILFYMLHQLIGQLELSCALSATLALSVHV